MSSRPRQKRKCTHPPTPTPERKREIKGGREGEKREEKIKRQVSEPYTIITKSAQETNELAKEKAGNPSGQGRPCG